jgi:type IV pilus assembly protein PilW
LYPVATKRPADCTAAGFTLVEIMVGMVIGVLGLIIMMQVFSLSESQKRTTTGGGDAQSSGAIALFGLKRDLAQAGYNAADPNLLGCNVTLRAGVTLNAIAPVTINHASITGQDANTDTLLIVYGNSGGVPQGDGIAAQPASAGAFVSPDDYQPNTPSAFANGDQIIATPPNRATPCALTLTTTSVVPLTSYIGVTAGTGINLGAQTQGALLFNLGPAPKIHAYAIRSGNLTQCDYMVNNCGNPANNNDATIWVPISNNIVSLKAQYGRDTMNGLNSALPAMDGIVDWYAQTTPYGPASNPVFPQGTAQPTPPMNAGVAGPTYQCAYARISAVRLVVVARNANFEKTAVTTTAPTWEGSTQNLTPALTATDSIGWTADPIDLTQSIPSDSTQLLWQNYRYRVIQMVVPLRNLVWQGVPSGC